MGESRKGRVNPMAGDRLMFAWNSGEEIFEVMGIF